MSRDSEFTEFAAGAAPGLLRLAYLLEGQQAGAEDLLQSVLTRLFVKWPAAARADHPAAYARRSMVNLHVEQRRRRQVPTTQLEGDGGSASPDHGDDVAWSLDLARHLRSLAPRQRAVLVLRFYEDLSVAETADVLGCATGTVKSQTSDARCACAPS